MPLEVAGQFEFPRNLTELTESEREGLLRRYQRHVSTVSSGTVETDPSEVIDVNAPDGNFFPSAGTRGESHVADEAQILEVSSTNSISAGRLFDISADGDFVPMESEDGPRGVSRAASGDRSEDVGAVRRRQYLAEQKLHVQVEKRETLREKERLYGMNQSEREVDARFSEI
jgi:hypothetical protein